MYKSVDYGFFGVKVPVRHPVGHLKPLGARNRGKGTCPVIRSMEVPSVTALGLRDCVRDPEPIPITVRVLEMSVHGERAHREKPTLEQEHIFRSALEATAGRARPQL